MSRRFPRLPPILLSLLLLPGAAGAASVKIWVSDTAADFSTGEARGVSVTADGSLLPGKSLSRVDGVNEAVLFAAVRGKSGELYVGTGDSGKILRVTPEGKVDTYATLDEKEVTALRIGPDGALYAGASPGGKVYRIVNGKSTLYYDTRAEYVWALAFEGKVLYVGTGLPGEIHRVTAALAGERVHVTPDAHVRSLYADAQGRVWAGTSGSGLILRLDKTGQPTTLYDSGKPEVTAIVADKEGRVWAAAGTAEMTTTASEPASTPQSAPSPKAPKAGSPTDDDDKGKAEVSVSVSSVRLAPPRGGAKGGYSSELVLFEEGEPARIVWTSNDEVVFDLARDDDGSGVLAATGPKGKMYEVASDASALMRTFDEKQVTFFAGDDVGTNASSAIYMRKAGNVSGEYVSAVKDTGRTSRFGAFRWEGDSPSGSRVEFAFRSGESAAPDTTWSPWSAWSGGEKSVAIAAPDGRFLQWRVRMSGEGAHAPVIRRTEAAYRNHNAAPAIDSLVALDPAEVLLRSGSGGSNVLETSAPDERGIFTGLEDSKSEGSPRRLFRKGFRTLQWKATDPDGDPLSYDVEFRTASSSKWMTLRKDVRETFYSFDSSSLPDGDYVFRVAASDAENNPTEAKTTTRESVPVRIDNTPPVIRQLSSAPGVFQFEAFDAASPLTEAEYSLDARKWTRVEPADGLSDSLRETYAIHLPPEAKGGYLLIRVTDASRNVASASFTAP
ncbi:MAG TPA: two-component regulator propeller domain-containing protein [Thermoanaerobaculia bacterium]